MWIVRLALRRPYTFVVLAILILIMGTFAALRTPTDIFPNINIPVVSIIWNYTGLAPQDMASRIISLQERNLTTTVNDIEHLESQSLNGIAVIKVFFHPGANISTAIAQIAGQSQTQLKQLPLGTTPPLIITYSASSVPILQLALSSPTLSEQQLNDYGLNFIRPQLTSVPGAAVPYPYGGKQRQVQVDLNTTALQAKGLSPLDVVNAISAQNLILPTGTAKIGTFEYNVDMNGSPTTIQGLNDLPIKTCLRPRRLSTPDQYRARRWTALDLDDDPKDRNRFHTKHHRRYQAALALREEHASTRSTNSPPGRSVCFCAWRHHWRNT